MDFGTRCHKSIFISSRSADAWRYRSVTTHYRSGGLLSFSATSVYKHNSRDVKCDFNIGPSARSGYNLFWTNGLKRCVRRCADEKRKEKTGSNALGVFWSWETGVDLLSGSAI